jgi:putative tricarboxylic transport membrane protein
MVAKDEKGLRGDVLPDVPTFVEQGINFTFSTIHLFLGPKGMDPALVKKIYDYYVGASKDDAVNAILRPAGFEMEFFGYDEGIAKVKSQQEELNGVVAALGLKQ